MPSTGMPLDLYITLVFCCFGAGALVPLLFSLFSRQKGVLTFVSLATALAGSIVTIFCAVRAWQTPIESSDFFRFALPLGQMPVIAFSFYADRLAAFFLMLTGILALAVTLHLTSWLEDLPDRHRIAAVFNLFVLAIVLTLLSSSVYSFLVFQECMTLSFAYLVLFRHNLYLDRDGVSALDMEGSKMAFKSYLIFEHVGTTLIAISLLLLAAPGISNSPDALRFAFFTEQAVTGSLHSLVINLVFLFALAGFGIKAGIFPAHVWVTMVHPYSPTSIHAMMSGIALKTAGLYGMYRVFFFFLSPVQWWWGWIVLLLAGMTALFGVFYAILEKDLKTALASHSVENVGIILAGIGLALIFYAEADVSNVRNIDATLAQYAEIQRPYLLGLAGLSLIASLYHLLNHSIFKALLFFCTGAIENRLGVVALDRMGGLIKRYPLTSTAFLVGSVAIAGFPPFNGFVSKWLLIQSFFAGMGVYFTEARVFLLFGMVAVLLCLVLAFSMTALAFVKIAGEALLGAPRDPQVAKMARSGEVRWPMRSVLIVFALLCLLLGMLPSLVVQFLAQPAADMVDGFRESTPVLVNLNLSLHMIMVNPQVMKPEGADLISPGVAYQTKLSILVILSLSLILAYSIAFSLLLLGGRRSVRTEPPWTCGVPFFDQIMQYTGTAFASLILTPFIKKPESGPGAEALPRLRSSGSEDKIHYRISVTPGRYVPEFTRKGYNYLLSRLLALSEQFGLRAQPGDIRVYLMYIFVIFISILLFLLLTQGGNVR